VQATLQSSFELWDGLTFWLAGFGALLLLVYVGTGFEARRYARRLAEEAERDKARLNAELADAKARAAEANLKAEQEHLARVQLEAVMTPID
jgi:hypothetical protein